MDTPLLPRRKAYYRATLDELLDTDCNDIVNALARATLERFRETQPEALKAWEDEVLALQRAARALTGHHEPAGNWTLLLEYPLLRLEKRIDAVLLARDIIFVLEFKTAAPQAAAIAQCEEYALALRDFHAASAGRIIVPVLVADGQCSWPAWQREQGHVHPVATVVPSALGECLLSAFANLSTEEEAQPAIEPDAWDGAPYRPVPSIIEAAELLYAGHSVAEIANAGAASESLAITTSRLIELVREARARGRHYLCLVTGVPGSGKTLAGLNLVHNCWRGAEGGISAAFLSGNPPLVAVLREALARDAAQRKQRTIKDVRREIDTAVQPLIGFLHEYLKHDTKRAPHEHVIVFDEAQRAWDADQGRKKFERAASEPLLFLEIMARHQDWSVIIGLVGNGQEINRGEHGLAEWGAALEAFNQSRAPSERWQVFAPARVMEQSAKPSDRLFQNVRPESVALAFEPSLHLAVSVRSHRCPVLADWVDAVLTGDQQRARLLATNAGRFPIYITRSLDATRNYLSSASRGHRRCGLVASSRALRLRAEGLGVSLSSRELDPVANWYLKPRGDIRSSFALEVTANEYTCQGLELDHVGVCWGGDLLWSADHWVFSKFSGNQWLRVSKAASFLYILNTYRVLLTRARESLIIWVPRGSTDDPTRAPEPLDETASFLQRCGAQML